MKKIGILLLALTFIFVLSACGGDDKAAPADEANAKEIVLEASNFKFDQETYEVAQGDTVKFTLDNVEGLHGIEIQGLGVKLDTSKKSQTIALNKAGEYKIICNIFCGNGHADMVSTLIVK